MIDAGAENVVCILHDITNQALRKRCMGGKMFNCESTADLDQDEPAVSGGSVTCDAEGNGRTYTIEETVLLASTSCNGGEDTWTCGNDGEGDLDCQWADSCCTCADIKGD